MGMWYWICGLIAALIFLRWELRQPIEPHYRSIAVIITTCMIVGWWLVLIHMMILFIIRAARRGRQ